MTELLKLPYLGTAEEDVLFTTWFVQEGAEFSKGDCLAMVETLKATFEVEAEQDGVLHRQLVTEGERIATDLPLGVITDPGQELDEAVLEELLAATGGATAPTAGDEEEAAPRPSSATTGSSGTGVRAAPAARRLAAERGIDLDLLRGTGPDGLIRVQDVELAAQGGGPDGPGDGTLDAGFVDLLNNDTEAFGALSSESKVALYRKHGAVLGEGTRIGKGTVLRVDRLVLGRDCVFREGCSVEAREFVAGDLLYLGPRSRVRCRGVHFGDNAFLTEEIDIGGGGAFDPEAELQVGSHGFIGEQVHLNVCRPLLIGDEVVISRNAVLMTHSFGASILKGYPNRFAGIRLGDCCQVGIHATLFPGVEMGEGSILLSGSSLVSSVPAGRLFGGVPATDLKAAAAPLSDEAFDGIARDLVVEFARQMELRGRAVTRSDAGAELRVVVRGVSADHGLRLATDRLDECDAPLAEEVRVYCRPSEAEWNGVPPEIAAIDLSAPAVRGPAGPLLDAFREFLRKRGVRLKPRAWTYRGGWL